MLKIIKTITPTIATICQILNNDLLEIITIVWISVGIWDKSTVACEFAISNFKLTTYSPVTEIMFLNDSTVGRFKYNWFW